MAFKLYSTDDGHVPAWEYIPVISMKLEAGMGLAYDHDSGYFDASKKPTHICMRTETVDVKEGTIVPAVKIGDDQVWESLLFDEAPSLKVGQCCDVSSSGLWVSARNIVNNNFQISYLEDVTMDSIVRGRFVVTH